MVNEPWIVALSMTFALSGCSTQAIEGQTDDSPDSLYSAYVSAPLSQPKEPWFEIWIEEKQSGTRVNSIRVELPIGAQPNHLRNSERIIEWSPDSKSATFAVSETQRIELRVP